EAVESGEFTTFHGGEHVAQMPALFVRKRDAVSFFKLCANLIVLDVLEAGETIGNGAHIAAALHVVLPAQRANAAAIASNVSGYQSEINQSNYVIDRIVVFGNAERPAKLGAAGFGVSMGGPANNLSRYAGFFFGALQRVFLYMCFVR